MEDKSSAAAAYRLDQLGWLQFERLCSLVIEREAGLSGLEWLGHADRGRVALVDQPVVATALGLRLAGPLAVAVVWVRADGSREHALSQLFAGISAVPSELGGWLQRVLVLTNLDARAARRPLDAFSEVEQFAVLGARELGESLDRHAALRAAMPSVLGLRDLAPLIDAEVQARSSLDLEGTRELARVFWPTRAYERARTVLARHRFVVLTGPPEMGKTAIARMLALGQLTDGWEVHECSSPEGVWQAFDRERRQLFVADDAFGSTEYRADAADRWARDLSRMLVVLDEKHWLIWTSRPAPLKAGLRRVQRERGAERFPAPGEVLVDAGALDLAEKTLILFRHAKSGQAGPEACRLLRSAGVSIVEHPHFTPERIRRFVTERLGALGSAGGGDIKRQVLGMVERELARPTDAMRNSFRALEVEHRELLMALLDAPAGLIDERELAATLRRHHRGGLSRPPSELIDRLTDHFLRVTPLGIGWVHPSWRDLVIGELREDAAARRRFLAACGIYGAMLALSREGGVAGERGLPLLVTDTDWDALGDRLFVLLGELEDQDLARLLTALDELADADIPAAQAVEVQSLVRYMLGATRRAWDKQARPLPVFLLHPWYALNDGVAEPVSPPALDVTWAELHPSRSSVVGSPSATELREIDDWLWLAQILAHHDRAKLGALGFYDQDNELLGHLALSLSARSDPDIRPLAESVLRRVRDLAPEYHALTNRPPAPRDAGDERWWVPEDIPEPPSTEPVTHERIKFTREDVDRVLRDL